MNKKKSIDAMEPEDVTFILLYITPFTLERVLPNSIGSTGISECINFKSKQEYRYGCLEIYSLQQFTKSEKRYFKFKLFYKTWGVGGWD